MKRLAVACDLDGTLTESGLHYGGTSRIGQTLWRGMVASGLAERAMARACYRPLALQVLREALDHGWLVDIVTLREERFQRVTICSLNDALVPYAHLAMRPAGVDPIEHKALWVGQAHLYIDDDRDVAEAVAGRLGEAMPPTVLIGSWRFVPAIMRVIEEVKAR